LASMVSVLPLDESISALGPSLERARVRC